MQGQFFAGRPGRRRRRMAAMNHDEFERFVLKFGKDILRFCRMTAGDAEDGDELYQDTMLKLLEKKKRLDSAQNTKSYALSTSIYLWKNKKKKYANRMRLVPMNSMDEMADEGYEVSDHGNEVSPEYIVLQKNEVDMIQRLVASLPEKYRIPIYLYYSAGMQINEVSEILGLPEGTVKSRIRRAKQQLKEKLEAIGYDR
jgi:RNA polymerase sigma-70 factor (ECF subfamily)